MKPLKVTILATNRLVMRGGLWSKFSTSSRVRMDADSAGLSAQLFDLDEEFKGLTGVSKCAIAEIDGPEPNYQSLNPNSYNVYKHQDRFLFRNGGVLPEVEVAYETWGKLNESKSNAVLLFTGLSANSHAKSNQVLNIKPLFHL